MNIGGVDVKIYAGQVEPYEDLALGRLDAVLLDLPIAAYYAKPNPTLKYTVYDRSFSFSITPSNVLSSIS